MQEEIEKAKSAAFRLLSYRMRSCREIADKLREKDFPERTVHSVIQYLKGINYLDDSQFAKEFVESRLNHNPKGKRLLHHELSQKGIESSIINEVLGEKISNEKEEDIARNLAEKVWQKKKNIEETKRKAQTYNYLARRGFPTSLVTKILEELRN